MIASKLQENPIEEEQRKIYSRSKPSQSDHFVPLMLSEQSMEREMATSN